MTRTQNIEIAEDLTYNDQAREIETPLYNTMQPQQQQIMMLYDFDTSTCPTTNDQYYPTTLYV